MTIEYHFSREEFFNNVNNMASDLILDEIAAPKEAIRVAEDFTLEGFTIMARKEGADVVSIGGIRIAC